MSDRKKITTATLFKKVADGDPITWLTGYDYPTAYFHEEAGIDMILVGDSLGMTMLGYDSTLPVTMDDMIRHTQAVRRGAPTAFVVGDMPYMSYQPSVESAIRNAGRFMAETGCDAIKLEGGAEMADRMAGIVAAGIPAMRPSGTDAAERQARWAASGCRARARSRPRRSSTTPRRWKRPAPSPSCWSWCPTGCAKLITERAENCIIMSLGSGPDAHGQLLIYHDLFGLYPKFTPRMAKVYGNAGAGDPRRRQGSTWPRCRHREFPQPDNYFGMKDAEYDELTKLLANEA